MKTITAAFFSIALFVTVSACNNEKKEEPKSSSSASPATDKSKKTEISVGPGGAEVKTKDASVKISTKDSTEK